MFLLDTNILSDASKPEPVKSIATWLRQQEVIAIPFPAILELEQGIQDLAAAGSPRAVKLTKWLDELLEKRFQYPPVTPEVARQLSRLNTCNALKNFWCFNPQSTKEKRPSQDLFIAAIAIVYDLPIATRNGKDFKFINRFFALPGVYDPDADRWIVPSPQLNERPAIHGRVVQI